MNIEHSRDTEHWNSHALARAAAVLEERGERLPQGVVRALAREVIARLEQRRRALEGQPSEEKVRELCEALLGPDAKAGLELVLSAKAAGMDVDTIHLGYIAEAVRLLGRRWEEDELSFVEVALGAGRVYGILREMREMFISDLLARPGPMRAAFLSTPGETHTLGITMAADYMRRRGWTIDLRIGESHAELVEAMGQMRYPVIGLSASATAMTFSLARLIVALRVSNPEAWIIVGGNIVNLEPEIASIVDADAASADSAVALALIDAQIDRLQSIGGK